MIAEFAGLALHTASFIVGMIATPVVIYFLVRAIPGLVNHGPITWLFAPLQMLIVSEYRPQYQRDASRLRLSLVAMLIAAAIFRISS